MSEGHSDGEDKLNHRLVVARGLLEAVATPRGAEMAAEFLGVASGEDANGLRRMLAEEVRDLAKKLEEQRGGPPTLGNVPTPVKQPKLKGRGRKGAGTPEQAAFEKLHPRVKSGRGGGQFLKKGEGMGQGAPPGGSPRVEQLQARLGQLGEQLLDEDGRFGPKTEAAVKRFQEKYGLQPTGVVDRATIETMRNPPPLSVAQVQAEERAAQKGTTKSAGATRTGRRSSRSGSGGKGSAAPTYSIPGNQGMVKPGNIDLNKRKVARNRDGSISTEKSISIGVGKNEVLIPTVVNGKVVSDEDAIAHYKKTGENLGTFKSVAEANAYAEALHKRQQKFYSGGGRAGRSSRSRKSKSTSSGTSKLVRRGDGMTGGPDSKVRNAQEILDDLGFDLGDGGVDGRFGEGTEAAVKRFQRRYGLRVDGIIGPQTLAYLKRIQRRQEKEAKEEGYLSADEQPTSKQGTKRQMVEASYVNVKPPTPFGTKVPYGGAVPFLLDPTAESSVGREPPNLRGATGWEACKNCVFGTMTSVSNPACRLYAWPVGPDLLCDSHATLTADEQQRETLKEAATTEGEMEQLEEVKSSAYPGLDRSPRENWVDKAGGLPKYIERIAKHLHYEKGMTIGHAIAVAVNAVKRMCASGDTNFPGAQQVNVKSRAEACAAVASWEKKKIQHSATVMETVHTIERLSVPKSELTLGFALRTIREVEEIDQALADGWLLEEAVLTAERRKKLPSSSFALPGGRYPIHDEAHARNALARVAQHGTPEEKAKVRAAVKRRYPNIEIGEAVLTSQQRKKLPASAFAIPPDRYPIHDEAHARNALARVSQHGTPEEKRKVRNAVKRRYPHIFKGSVSEEKHKKQMQQGAADPFDVGEADVAFEKLHPRGRGGKWIRALGRSSPGHFEVKLGSERGFHVPAGSKEEAVTRAHEMAKAGEFGETVKRQAVAAERGKKSPPTAGQMSYQRIRNVEEKIAGLHGEGSSATTVYGHRVVRKDSTLHVYNPDGERIASHHVSRPGGAARAVVRSHEARRGGKASPETGSYGVPPRQEGRAPARTARGRRKQEEETRARGTDAEFAGGEGSYESGAPSGVRPGEPYSTKRRRLEREAAAKHEAKRGGKASPPTGRGEPPWKAEVAANRAATEKRLAKAGHGITLDELQYADDVLGDDDPEVIGLIERGDLSGLQKQDVVEKLQKSSPIGAENKALRDSLVKKLQGGGGKASPPTGGDREKVRKVLRERYPSMGEPSEEAVDAVMKGLGKETGGGRTGVLDRGAGKHQGKRVTVLGPGQGNMMRVRLPDGTETTVHKNMIEYPSGGKASPSTGERWPGAGGLGKPGPGQLDPEKVKTKKLKSWDVKGGYHASKYDLYELRQDGEVVGHLRRERTREGYSPTNRPYHTHSRAVQHWHFTPAKDTGAKEGYTPNLEVSGDNIHTGGSLALRDAVKKAAEHQVGIAKSEARGAAAAKAGEKIPTYLPGGPHGQAFRRGYRRAKGA